MKIRSTSYCPTVFVCRQHQAIKRTWKVVTQTSRRIRSTILSLAGKPINSKFNTQLSDGITGRKWQEYLMRIETRRIRVFWDLRLSCYFRQNHINVMHSWLYEPAKFRNITINRATLNPPPNANCSLLGTTGPPALIQFADGILAFAEFCMDRVNHIRV